MNRDFVTVSQPEVRAVPDQMVRYSPLTMLDMHGYVWSTLIEPTTGPHGDNYEYDLYIPKALRNGLAMEARVVSDVGDAWRPGQTPPVLAAPSPATSRGPDRP